MAINIYMKMDNITGGSTAAGHEGEIEVLSWSHGFVQPTSPTRSTAGAGTVEQATHQTLNFTKYIDPASTVALKSLWGGNQVATATLTCYRADGATDNAPVKYLEVAMTNVIIANYSISGGEGDLPIENIALNYGTVQYTYVDQKHADGTADANLPATHNLETRVIS
ncbi:MAG TPA: type VI secretion system tube protein Hcp [Thermoanaerobaculia bacterium]